MTREEAVAEIRRRAGVKKKAIPVTVVSDGLIPPTLRDRRGRVARRARHEPRQVVVSTEWLRTKAPKLWAAFVAARLMGTSN